MYWAALIYSSSDISSAVVKENMLNIGPVNWMLWYSHLQGLLLHSCKSCTYKIFKICLLNFALIFLFSLLEQLDLEIGFESRTNKLTSCWWTLPLTASIQRSAVTRSAVMAMNQATCYIMEEGGIAGRGSWLRGSSSHPSLWHWPFHVLSTSAMWSLTRRWEVRGHQSLRFTQQCTTECRRWWRLQRGMVIPVHQLMRRTGQEEAVMQQGTPVYQSWSPYLSEWEAFAA